MTEAIKEEDLREAVKACTIDRDADMLTYSGPVFADNVNEFIVYALRHRRQKNIVLELTTYGGDAHAAYRLGRFLQDFFERIRLLIVGPCKSAGTLVTLAAHQLAFSPLGELGPLDIQVTKKDDLMSVGSGLDTLEALSILEGEALSTFKRYLFDILAESEGAISTSTAADMAVRLVAALIQPLAAQIDPQKMGEMERMISIAKAYGERLGLGNLKPGALYRLVRGYTSHSFIIDYKEARDLFKNAQRATKFEFIVSRALHNAGTCILIPPRETIFGDVRELVAPTDKDGENEADIEAATGSIGDPAAAVEGASEPSSAGKRRRAARTRRPKGDGKAPGVPRT